MINNLTINKSITEFIQYLHVNNNAESTINCYSHDMNIFLDFIAKILNNKIRYTYELKPIHLEQYKKYLRNDCNYCIKTSSRKYNCLRSYIKYLAIYNLVDNNLVTFLSNDTFGNTKRDKFSYSNPVISDENIKNILKIIDNNFLTFSRKEIDVYFSWFGACDGKRKINIHTAFFIDRMF